MHVEAIVFEYEDNEEVDVEQLSKMSNLRLLIIGRGRYIPGSPLSLSNALRYVEWSGYPFKYLPSSFHPNELALQEKTRFTTCKMDDCNC